MTIHIFFLFSQEVRSIIYFFLDLASLFFNAVHCYFMLLFTGVFTREIVLFLCDFLKYIYLIFFND